jgi:hypothetical protein
MLLSTLHFHCYAECPIFIVMLKVLILNVIVLSVVAHHGGLFYKSLYGDKY